MWNFPVACGKKLVFNPNSSSLTDNNCLLKCLAAFALKLQHENKNKQNKRNHKIQWRDINRKLNRPENIEKKLKIKGLHQNQFSDIKSLEVLNNFSVNVYKIVKESNSPKYDIVLIKRANKKMKHKRNIILYDYFKSTIPVTHCFLVKSSFQNFIRNFSAVKHLYDKEKECKIYNHCFTVFQNKQQLINHKKSYCVNKHNNLRIQYPQKMNL